MSYALDSTSASAVGAWSLYRRLVGSYGGNCIRVRRSSDDSEQDIGFGADGYLDESALSTFVGSNNGFVAKVYDQSGNSNDLSQSTNSQQPQIVVSGVINKFAGTSIVYCDFITGTWLERSDACGISGNSGYAWFGIFDVVGTAFGPTEYPLICGFGSGTTAGQEVNFAADSSTRYDNGNKVFNSQWDGLDVYSVRHPSSGTYNSTEFYVDGSSLSASSSTHPTYTPNFANDFTTMGGYIDIGVAFAPDWSYSSQWSEWILFDSAVSDADRDLVIAEQHSVVYDVNDRIFITDATSREHNASRPVSDSVGVADQIVTESTDGTNTSDAVVVADIVATNLEYSRSASDAVVVADGAQREYTAARTLADSTAVAEQTSVAVGYIRATSDTQVVTDAVTVVAEFERTATDSATTADTSLLTADFTRHVADNANVADVAVSSRVLDRATVDTIATTDDIVREHDASRSETDAVAPTDATAVESGSNVAVADAIATIEIIIVEMECARSVSDAISTEDGTKIASYYSRSALDSVVVTDAAAVELEFTRSASDAQSASDTVAREHNASRAIGDYVIASDVTAAGEIVVTTVDTVAITDIAVRECDAARVSTDLVVTNDLATFEKANGAVVADAVQLSDVVAIEAEFVRSSTDASAVADVVAIAFTTPNVLISDAIQIADVTGGSLEAAAVPADALSVADTIGAIVTLGASVSDSANATDQVSVDILNLNPDVIDTTDRIVRFVGYDRSVADAVAMNDLVAEGDLQAYAETIDGGVVIGGVDAHTVNPFGPVSASGGSGCYADPIGFVLETGDQVLCTDSFYTGLERHVIIGDIVAVAEA